MARIAGVNLPKEKRVEIGLTYIFGIGRSLSKTILEKVKIDLDKKVKDLSEEEADRIREEIKRIKTEGDLRRDVTMSIKRLQEVGSYRGYRHRVGLPCRGQRTRTNSRTKKGKRKTVANKKTESK